MNTQAKVLLNTLEAKGWFIDSIENPKSSSYWWVWEFWTIKENQNKVVLSFLIDPQSEKRIQMSGQSLQLKRAN
jgi:hypothetical protein